MDLTNFFIIILSLLIIYLLYKTRNLEKLSIDLPNVENFETSIDDAVNTKYTSITNAMRNLINITSYIITNNDSFYISSNSTNLNNITVDNSMTINGPIVIDGDINAINRSAASMNYLPQYTVIPWPNNDVPLGWGICDGSKYKLDIIGRAIRVSANNESGIYTPDLRCRFILGSGNDTTNVKLTPRVLNERGGEEEHLLTIQEMARHNHTFKYTDGAYDREGNTNQSSLESAGRGAYTVETSKIGGDKKHNNIPPFHVLNYIMKI